MIKARQLNIMQETNNDLMNIRCQELDFYNDVFITVGILASTLSGFMFADLQQVTTTGFIPPEDDDPVDCVFLVLVTAAGMMGMRITLVTIYANVYGQSLAIRGPLGSVTRAVDSLHKELQSIMQIFTIMFIIFLVAVLVSNYVIMTGWPRHVCTGIIIVQFYFTYCSVLRIFNRSRMTPGELDELDHEHKDEQPQNEHPISKGPVL